MLLTNLPTQAYSKLKSMSIEQNSPINPGPDWNIEELYRKAWEIVKKNKILWVFAAAVGSGMSFNNNINYNGGELENFRKFFENKPTPGSDEFAVLGAATNSFSDMLTHLFSSVPPWFYIALALEIIFLILAGIIISSVYQAWAQGSLLENIQVCINGGKADIREASQKAFGYLKPLIFLQIVPGLILMLTFILSFIIAVILLIIIINGALKIVFGLLILILILAAFIAFLMFNLTLIWAQRLVITEKQSGINALKKGYKIARKKFWASLLLGTVNSILSGIITLIPIFVIAVIGIGGVFAAWKIEIIRIPLVAAGIFVFIALIILLTLLASILTAFKAAVWSLAYMNIQGKYD